MMLPWALPGWSKVSGNAQADRSSGTPTEGNGAVTHPRCGVNGLVRGETRNFVASEEIPDDGGQAGVAAHDEAAGGAIADIVGGNEENVLVVALEATLDGEGVVMQAKDDGALGV